MNLRDRQIYWLEQHAGDVPSEDSWLTSAERSRLATFGVAKRRSDWRLGRWTSKCATAAYMSWPQNLLRDIEVVADSSGAPRVLLPDQTNPPEISISHSHDVCMCVIGPPGVWIGCDIETVEMRSHGFMETFFTDREMAAVDMVGARAAALASLIWSAKESYLKATREGLRHDTREVEVMVHQDLCENTFESQDGWSLLSILSGGRSAMVYWRWKGGFVETVSHGNTGCAEASQPPVGLMTVCSTTTFLRGLSGF